MNTDFQDIKYKELTEKIIICDICENLCPIRFEEGNEMHIDSYEFGRMTVDGEVYSSDLIILPDRIIGNWWRAQGHSLSTEDLKEVVRYPLHLLLLGTGMYGMMQVPETTVRELKEKGIETLILKTKEAYRIFNEQAGKGGVAAAFHLTC